MQAILSGDLNDNDEALNTALVQTLARMRADNHGVGQMDWVDGDKSVCRFFWSTYLEKLIEQRRGDYIHKTQLSFNVFTIHDVVDTLLFPYRDYQGYIPKRVRTLLGAVPDWLDKQVKILDGTMIREQIVEQQIGIKEWDEHAPVQKWEFEPGVLIGSYVLTGWLLGEK